MTRAHAILIGACALWMSGCAGQINALNAKIQNLERDVVRLSAEKANIAARNAALDDELLVIQKKLEDRRNSPDGDTAGKPVHLPVVRLAPAEEDTVVAFSMAPGDGEDWPKPVADDGKRPVLKIMGYAPDTSTTVAGGGLPTLGNRASDVPLTDGGDNLGVVKGGSPGASGPMELFHAAYKDFTNNNFDAALDGFGEFLSQNASHDYADNAIFWRGECYLAKGNSLRAIGEMERMLRRFPRSEKRPSALYRIGYIYDKLHDYSKAREYYFKVVDAHPGTDAARKASRRVAEMGADGGRTAAAVPVSARR